ncbi:L-fuculokinase [Pasteurella multocida]|uniref:L-fuculokinase n=1 Tax=Pasteurella multocida TaxID=747 RepID=UPI002947DF8F|nr:L-fuculokinase [Pasteurella multocida]MEB3450861.1 L-fuculokinase [Pasteurella multocida]MEB3453277.1 L-fuculokinase [Pasteurella multocida]MEB3455227.1 L-fuculokinase [Pasteurella multocida]MEB3459640.1 L-fuculokinase [Pasteurella multocida]MEB3462176.1 L-fuculokinase [Pasteurella multocida]
MSIVLIFDCGATNLRTIAINETGKIVASHHLANNTQVGAESGDYHIWDFEEIWQKLICCAENTLAQLKQQQMTLSEVQGIAVTTFGVDGAPFDKDGKQLYPIISWKCPRTMPIMENLATYFDVQQLYLRNGIGQYSFNTLFKLIWLKENQPDVFANMDKFVFISSMLSQRLTGVFSTDHTMAGTSMMTHLQTGDWDDDVLHKLGLTKQHFPPIKYAGEKIGQLTPALANQLGLSQIPVFSAGHDTQFAVFGSGAGLNQPVLSSGTWEILMARTESATPQFQFVPHGLTTEFDAKPHCFNPAVQWVGSGVMEWIGKLFFAEVKGTPAYYPTMIREGEVETVGAGGVTLLGYFHANDQQAGLGSIAGLSMHTRRGQIYRAALEYMAFRLKEGLTVLQQVSQFKAESLLCVGGGSKNALWNQIRADVLAMPIDVVDVAESTVLGAAMFTFAALGVYTNVEQAQQHMKPKTQRIMPSQNAPQYQRMNQHLHKNATYVVTK